MQILPQDSLEAISGGQAKQLIVTQTESIGANISKPCMQVLRDAAEFTSTKQITNISDAEHFEDIFFAKILNACTFSDLLSFGEESPYLTVEYR